MHLAVVIPAFNEEETIAKVIESIPVELPGISRTSVVVVDDGSTDLTRERALDSGALVVSHSKNKGVGMAFRTGVKEALKLKADILVNIDADGQFNPQDIKTLIEPIVEDRADFVTASRFIDHNMKPKMPWIKYFGNKCMSRLISILTRKKFYDVSCGFRAYSKETLLKLNLFGKFTYTQETFLDLVFKDLRLLEIPIKVIGVRQHGKSKVASNLFRYGASSLSIILHSFVDYRPLAIFGILSLLLFTAGLGFGVFFIGHFIRTGQFSPNIWAGFLSGFFFTMSFLVAVFSILGDMLSRVRLNQEEILYLLKRHD